MRYSDLYERILDKKEKVAIIGLGYVGLSIALAFCSYVSVIGYDIDKEKISMYKNKTIMKDKMSLNDQQIANIEFSSDETSLEKAGIYIIAVPTPTKEYNLPDLSLVENASRIVGRNIKRGAVIVYESTVYPGATEEICIPILECMSGLICGVDFKVGYSPERINPGDNLHRLEEVAKIVSGIDEETLEILEKVYKLIIHTDIHKVRNIKVAEAAKLVENCQRDINVAFMNEISIIFHKLNIDTKEVLQAARTKWNFCDFTPGLVGGHCIGIDPYYLIHKAKCNGYISKIVQAGRDLNESMSGYIVENLVYLMSHEGIALEKATVAVMGITFKEDCPDLRNSKALDIVENIQKHGMQCIVTDCEMESTCVKKKCNIELVELDAISNIDALVIAVPHKKYLSLSEKDFSRMYKGEKKRIIVDVKGIIEINKFESLEYIYWRL